MQFYLDAGAWMIDPDVMALEPWQAVGISIASLAFGWFVYDGLCRSPIGQKTTLLTVIGFLWVLAAAYFYTEVFSGRTAMIHVGAFIGTIMAANVFAVIIPNQKKVTAALLAGAAPDPKYGEIGKQRSIHNTYLTLPVLVTMVSGHYPMLSGHPQAWLIVAFIIVGGACLRHVLVSHEVGEPFATYRAALPVILIALFAAIYITTPQQRNTADIDVTDVQVMAIVQKHCTSCHAAKPKNEAVDAPPKNIILENTDQLSRHGNQVLQFAVQTRAMPLGNETGMTAQERLKLGAWIDNQIDGE